MGRAHHETVPSITFESGITVVNFCSITPIRFDQPDIKTGEYVLKPCSHERVRDLFPNLFKKRISDDELIIMGFSANVIGMTTYNILPKPTPHLIPAIQALERQPHITVLLVLEEVKRALEFLGLYKDKFRLPYPLDGHGTTVSSSKFTIHSPLSLSTMKRTHEPIIKDYAAVVLAED